MKINKPISIIIILIITLILIFLFTLPQYHRLSDLQNSVVKKQAEYDGKFIYYSKIAELIKGINSRKDTLAKIDSALPDDSYLSSMVYYFQKQATVSNLSVQSVTLSQISQALATKNIRDVGFSVHLSGTYQNFKQFIAALDNSARLIEVNSIAFSAPADTKQLKNQQPVYNFNLEVSTHTY